MSDETAQGLATVVSGEGANAPQPPETLTERDARGAGRRDWNAKPSPPVPSANEHENRETSQAQSELQEQIRNLETRIAAMDKNIEAARTQAGEEAYRRAQAKLDADLRRMRGEYSKREQKLLEALPGLGLDANQVHALQQERSRDDEIEELREQAALAQGYQLRDAAVMAREQYVASKCRDVEVDPNDPRLDKSSPEAFDRSLIRVVKEDAVKARSAPSGAYGERGVNPTQPPLAKGRSGGVSEEERKAANKAQVEPLGGAPGSGSGGKSTAETLQAELQQKLKELRGSGDLAAANALLREYREKTERSEQ